MKANTKPHTLSSRTIRFINQNLAKSVAFPTLQTTDKQTTKTEGQHTTGVAVAQPQFFEEILNLG